MHVLIHVNLQVVALCVLHWGFLFLKVCHNLLILFKMNKLSCVIE